MVVKIKSRLLVLGLMMISAVFSFSLSKVNIDDIEKSLACQCECGMTVDSCQGAMPCSSAAAISTEIKSLINQGEDKDTILKAFVAKYGEKILSAPTKKGFNLTAWTFPFLALLLGGYLVQLLVRRWVAGRQRARLAGEIKIGELNSRYKSTLEKELREFEE